MYEVLEIEFIAHFRINLSLALFYIRKKLLYLILYLTPFHWQ